MIDCLGKVPSKRGGYWYVLHTGSESYLWKGLLGTPFVIFNHKDGRKTSHICAVWKDGTLVDDVKVFKNFDEVIKQNNFISHNPPKWVINDIKKCLDDETITNKF